MPQLLNEALQYASTLPVLGCALALVIVVAAFSDKVNQRVVRLIQAFRRTK